METTATDWEAVIYDRALYSGQAYGRIMISEMAKNDQCTVDQIADGVRGLQRAVADGAV